MTKITQIEDRSAASAWSPIRNYPDVIALGAKVRSENVFQYRYSNETVCLVLCVLTSSDESFLYSRLRL
jgi:hypothetical protein